MILPETVPCRGKEFLYQLPHSFTRVAGIYVCDATYNKRDQRWTALANINGMLVLVEVKIRLEAHL